MQKKAFPVVNIAPAKILGQLDAIAPGVLGIPCSVTLHDGTIHEICLASENRRLSDKGNWLNPNMVAEVHECQFRLPAKFARVLYDAGESGMGYYIYVVKLDDGTQFVHMAADYLIDFVNFPAGYGPNDVANVFRNQGRGRPYRQVADCCSLHFVRTA